jgi:hypothetical protein
MANHISNKVSPNHYRTAKKAMTLAHQELVAARSVALQEKATWLAMDRTDEKALDAQWTRRDSALWAYDRARRVYWPAREYFEQLIPVAGALPRGRRA